MATKHFFTSLTRISDLPEAAFAVEPLPRREWDTGDYVVGEVASPPNSLSRIELSSGRMVEVVEGDLLVGAFGKRYATLEAVGGWTEISDDLRMEALTGAGLFGRATSTSAVMPRLLNLAYKGHVLLGGEKATMKGYVQPAAGGTFGLLVVLIVGTSMSAGKTTSAKVIVRLLNEAGMRVVGAKLTGAGRYRDILGLEDAGARHIFDFVDAGLPSTIGPEDEYRAALRNLLARIAATDADVMVAEIGASPLEPYNGAVAIEEIGANVRCTVLSASDPYAVSGVIAAFGKRPSFVTGLATSTEAGIALIENLSGLMAINVLDPASRPKIRTILNYTLGLESWSARPEVPGPRLQVLAKNPASAEPGRRDG